MTAALEKWVHLLCIDKFPRIGDVPLAAPASGVVLMSSENSEIRIFITEMKTCK